MVNLTLRGERVKRGLSVEDMAMRLNISPSAYRNKERGYRKFTPAEIAVILATLEKTFEEIFLPYEKTKSFENGTE